jgi:hypothetical protein
MTLIKYYKPDTCYDGQKEFTKNSPFRYYPDEYLIANILEKYHQKRFPDSKNIIVLTEPWLDLDDRNHPTRNGGANTSKINELVIQEIKLAKNLENTLILVPFLYGYHHPGITIDIKNKTAIYLNPFGNPASYSEVIALQELLEKEGFELLTVTAKQQRDEVSCGPILTASMIKFIEEFKATGRISVNDFKAPKLNLGTERLFQMYINNTEEKGRFVDEIMLADQALWRSVFKEQRLSTVILDIVLSAMRRQKKFIKSLPQNWEEDSSQKSAVAFIANFQSRITEYIFLKDKDIANKINHLVNASNQLFEKKDSNCDYSLLNELFKKEDLLSDELIDQTYKMIGLKDYSKNRLNQSNILNFEKNKNAIQEEFKASLTALKDKLGAITRDDEGLKEKGQILFDTLLMAQDKFFKELNTDSTGEEIALKITAFRKMCKEHLKIADKIMGHGWLYHTAEVVIKAVVGLFVGIGMVLGSVLGQGLAKSEHRKQFAKTFFTLNQNEHSQALNIFKQKILGDSEENQGSLAFQNFKK